MTTNERYLSEDLNEFGERKEIMRQNLMIVYRYEDGMGGGVGIVGGGCDVASATLNDFTISPNAKIVADTTASSHATDITNTSHTNAWMNEFESYYQRELKRFGELTSFKYFRDWLSYMVTKLWHMRASASKCFVIGSLSMLYTSSILLASFCKKGFLRDCRVTPMLRTTGGLSSEMARPGLYLPNSRYSYISDPRRRNMRMLAPVNRINAFPIPISPRP